MSDQPNRPVDTPIKWIRFAEGDLAVAEREMQSSALIASHMSPNGVIVFQMAQCLMNALSPDVIRVILLSR
jgi:hypothetical protein